MFGSSSIPSLDRQQLARNTETNIFAGVRMNTVVLVLAWVSGAVGAVSLAYSWLASAALGAGPFRLDQPTATLAALNGLESAGVGLIGLAVMMLCMSKFSAI